MILSFKQRIVPALVAMAMLCVEPNAVAVDRYVVRVAVQKVPTGWRWVHFGFNNLLQCTKFFLSARTKNANPRIYITQAGWDSMDEDDELVLSTIASMESGSVAVQQGTRCAAHTGSSRECTVDACIQLRLLPPPPPLEEHKEEKEEKEGKRSDLKVSGPSAGAVIRRFHFRRAVDTDAIEQGGARAGAQSDPVEADVARPAPEEEKKVVQPPREAQGAVGAIQQAAALDRPDMPLGQPPLERPMAAPQQPPQPLPAPDPSEDQLVAALLALPSPPQGVNASGLDAAAGQPPRIRRGGAAAVPAAMSPPVVFRLRYD